MALKIPKVISPTQKKDSKFPRTWGTFRENLKYQMGKYRVPRIGNILGRKR